MVLTQRSVSLAEHVISVRLLASILFLYLKIRRLQDLIVNSIGLIGMLKHFCIRLIFVSLELISRNLFSYQFLIFICVFPLSLSTCKFVQESIFKTKRSFWLKGNILFVLIFIFLRRLIMKFGRWLYPKVRIFTNFILIVFVIVFVLHFICIVGSNS